MNPTPRKPNTWSTADKVFERNPTDPELAEAARAEIAAEIAGYELAQLRKELGVTQTELAQRMGVTQGRVSAIERGDLAHTELDTVRSYIEALGGELRIVADLGVRSVDIRGLQRRTAA